MLILVELARTPNARLKHIAADLGITVQAVSLYISSMRRKGHVKRSDGGLKPTRLGMQLLQEHFTRIKNEVDEILREIAVVESCFAVAGKRIQKGQSVGLVMEDGILMAFPNVRSSSRGVALESADETDELLVGRLEGIVDLELGELLVIEVPPAVEGGSKKANISRAKQAIESLSPGLIVAGDIPGASLLTKATGELFTIHAPIESSMSALSKGVDVAFAGARESADQIVKAVASLRKSTGYEIKWRLIST
jgi:predicted transcriptional regulator